MCFVEIYISSESTPTLLRAARQSHIVFIWYEPGGTSTDLANVVIPNCPPNSALWLFWYLRSPGMNPPPCT